MNQPQLYLLDAYALIFRAYYAFINRPIINSKGLNTSAIFGFTNSLLEILQRDNPSHIAVVFDPPSPTFRKEIYAEYKANREQTPEDIKRSIPYIKSIIEALGIPILEVNNFEADDVIGTIAKKAEKAGYFTYMVTPDKDYGQLVSDKIVIYKPRRSGNDIEILGVKDICEKYTISDPRQVIDILALWGDASDNIPGVPGIGEKTSIKLISHFGSIENLLQNVDQLKGKQKENVINSKEQLELSKKLVTIALDVPVEFEPEQLKYHGIDQSKLEPVLVGLEFNSIRSRLFNEASKQGLITSVPSPQQPQQGNLFGESTTDIEAVVTPSHLNTIKSVRHEYVLVDTEDSLNALIEKLGRLKEFCFDTETTSLDAASAELVGLAISYKKGEAFYVPFDADRVKARDRIELFRDLFANTSIRKVGQNLKYDIQVLANYNIHVEGPLFDTMIAHYLIQPELKHNMDYLAETYLSYKPVSIESLIGKKGKGQLNMRLVDLDIISEYAAEDADITWQLKEILELMLEKDGLLKLAHDLEFPLIKVLSEMELSGVKIDTKALDNFAIKLEKEIIDIEEKIFELSGNIRFNIASPKQLGEVLFDKLRIVENAKKTKTKQYSTSEDTLVRLKDAHPIVDYILRYRSLTKLLSTYVRALPKLINPKTTRIHTSFNQAITATGRLSSNNPNLQNIPIREEEGREIRKAFIPESDEHVLMAVDYSQIELRLMAHMSNDPEMIQAFQSGEDIHTSTAAKIYKVALEEVTREQRSRAKTANFGIIYGISAFGLAQRLNIPRGEAKQLIDGYFATYKKVQQYMNQCIMEAKERGFVETIMGRKRYLKDIRSNNAIVRGIAERNAINAPIQGSAADIIKLAMIKVRDFIVEHNLKSKMILQVHDELVFDVYKPEMDTLKYGVKNIMESAMPLNVPLVVDVGIGNNWLEAH